MSRPTRADPSGRAYLDLQNRARREGRSTQELLTLYALERFLARLAMSRHAGSFVLKGGMLLAALNARRATVDADLLATDLDNQEGAVLQRIVEIATLVPEVDDGVRFSAQAANARIIREAALYAGVRVTMDARVSSATVKLQLDVNFGDPITPAPVVPIQLNHTLVNVRDKEESAPFVAEILGLASPTPYGPFLVVQVENDVSLDFVDVGTLHPQHYCVSCQRVGVRRDHGADRRPRPDLLG